MAALTETVVAMGFVRKRRGANGVLTYAAVYRDARGKVRHAGTFPTRRQAGKAWQYAEALMAAGRRATRPLGASRSPAM